VLIGANGSGKTSLLDVFSLLAVSASGGLKEKLSEMGGIALNLTTDLAREARFELCTRIPNGNMLFYMLSLRPVGTSYEIAEEKLAQAKDRASHAMIHIESSHGQIFSYFEPNSAVVRPTWQYDPLETALAQVPKTFQVAEAFRSQLASCTYYHVLNVEPRSPVRLPQPLRPATLPGRQGEDLVSCLFNLRETNRNRFEEVEDTLRAGFHDFERLDFPPVAAGMLAMTWKDRRFSRPMYMHQLSEGMLRFLWLVALLESPGLTAVTLLDEPEVSLHPELLSVLAGVMREASARTQLIVATHADRLVRFLEPKEVVAMDIKEDGTATAAWADTFDLEAWLRDYTLDEVWRMGRIGGRP
jgi:predicted ATPase